MNDREPELNEPMRGKLLAAARDLDVSLPAALEAQIVASLEQEAALQRTRRRFRRAGAAVGLAAAAAWTLVWWRGEHAQTERIARQSAAEKAACAWVSGAPRVFAQTPDGQAQLDLGARGRLVLALGARAAVARAEGCELVVELSSGTLAAALQDLRPGTLRVQTSYGDVVVHGTTFSVRMEDTLDVVLLQGAVDLESDGAVQVALTPGKAAHRAQRRGPPELREISAQDARAVNELLHGEAPAAPVVEPEQDARAVAPAPKERRMPKPASELLSEAEAARRAGDLDEARALYRAAAQSADSTAEIALLRHARLELDAGRARQASALLAEHGRRFAQSSLAAEASWLGVRARQVAGEPEAARAAARALIQRFPHTPQARAAERLLEQP